MRGLGKSKRASTRRLSRILTLLLFLLVTACAVGAYIVHSDRLRFEPVLSGSMRPAIQPGDMAILRPLPVDQLRVGDVIAYLPPDSPTPVMHRIVSLDAQGFITKGDANSVDDPWGRVVLPKSGDVNHLVSVIPHVGWVTSVRSQLMLALGVAVLLLLTLAVWTGDKKSDRPVATDPEGSEATTQQSSVSNQNQQPLTESIKG
jgi:signal peptidase